MSNPLPTSVVAPAAAGAVMAPAEKFSAVYQRCAYGSCSCTTTTSCHVQFGGILQEYQLPRSVDGPHFLFHARRLAHESEQFASVSRCFDEHFTILEVVEIENVFLRKQYDARREMLSFVAGGANEQTTYHVTKANLLTLCNEGLDPRLSQRGFFGKGVYLADSAVKANDYSSEKGNPGAVRVMLQCRVLLGRSKEYELGHFDRDLVTEPRGFHSVKGFIRRDTEYVVYHSDQVLIDRVIFYRYTNTESETSPCLQVPPNVTGHVVFISASLSEFFTKLQERAGPPFSDGAIEMKRLTAALLKQALTVESFLEQAAKLVKSDVTPGLADKIKAELDRSNLGPNFSGTLPGTTAASTPATTVAPASATPVAAPRSTPPAFGPPPHLRQRPSFGPSSHLQPHPYQRPSFGPPPASITPPASIAPSAPITSSASVAAPAAVAPPALPSPLGPLVSPVQALDPQAGSARKQALPRTYSCTSSAAPKSSPAPPPGFALPRSFGCSPYDSAIPALSRHPIATGTPLPRAESSLSVKRPRPDD